MKCKNPLCLNTQKLWKDGYCSTSCRNKVTKLNRVIDGYKKCKLCNKDFPYRNACKVRSSFSVALNIRIASVKQIFCSRTCSIAFKNKYNNPSKTERVRKIISNYAKNRGVSHMHTKEAHLKKSLSITGEGHWNWQGGITPKNKTDRNNIKYKNWRESVFKRDNYTCQICGIRGKELQADHIKPFAYFPKLRLNIDNGRTLCVECHKGTDTYMGRVYTKYGHKNRCHKVASSVK